MTTAVPESWNEFCKITIMREGDEPNGVSAAMYTEDITFDTGDKDIESIPLTSGGRIVKPTPMGDESLTLKVYPTRADLQPGGFVQLFHPSAIPAGSGDATTQPIVITNKKERVKHAVVLLWSTDLPSAATAVPFVGSPAYRIQAINAYMTGYKLNYDDKILNAEVTFKWAPFSRAGVGNRREESTDGSTTALDAPTKSAVGWT